MFERLIETSTESFLLASYYHRRGGRNGGCDSQHHGIHCNYYYRYSHIEAECRTKAREQQRQPMVVASAQPAITKEVTIPSVDYNGFLQFKATHQPSFFATVAQSGNDVAFVSTPTSLGP